MLNVIVSHKADLDGVASAALMIRKFVKNSEPFIIFMRDYEDESEVIPSALLGLRDCKVYISDISIMLKGFDKILERISKIDGKVLWTDHHEYTEENMKMLKDLGVDLMIDPNSPAAAILVAQRYGLDDEHSKRLVDMATQSDSWKIREEKVMDLVNIIDYYNYLEKKMERSRLASLSCILAQNDPDKMPAEDLKAVLEHYKKVKGRAFEKVLSTSTETVLNGLKFRFALSPSIISGTQATDLLIKNFKADVYIAIKEDGGVSFRRGRDDIDLSKMAALFGGGGHAYAAGAGLGDKIDEQKFRQLIVEMGKKISATSSYMARS
ncbi:MAG: DHHA1 domain-containing protein [Nitrososphaeria archaeon]